MRIGEKVASKSAFLQVFRRGTYFLKDGAARLPYLAYKSGCATFPYTFV